MGRSTEFFVFFLITIASPPPPGSDGGKQKKEKKNQTHNRFDPSWRRAELVAAAIKCQSLVLVAHSAAAAAGPDTPRRLLAGNPNECSVPPSHPKVESRPPPPPKLTTVSQEVGSGVEETERECRAWARISRRVDMREF